MTDEIFQDQVLGRLLRDQVRTNISISRRGWVAGLQSWPNQAALRVRNDYRIDVTTAGSAVTDTSIRGLVVSVPTHVSSERVQIRQSWLHEQELRGALLFWDVLDFPAARAFPLASTTETDFLQSAGVLQRSQSTINGHVVDLGAMFIDAHVATFRALDARDPGIWTLARGRNSLSFSSDDLEEGRGLLVRFHQAIPVPDRDVPLADILDFRQQRRVELLALRQYLEEIYQDVRAAPDKPLAEHTAVGKLDAAIGDHLRVIRERRFPFRMADVGLQFDFGPVMSTLVTAGTAITQGLPLTASMLTGVTAGFVTVGASAGLRGRQAQPTPFQYVSSYHRRLFS